MLADDDGIKARVAVFDIPTVIDDSDPVTRAYATGVLEVTALAAPETTVHVLPAITDRIQDPEPLVREAACGAIGWLASEHASPRGNWTREHTTDSWEALPASIQAQFVDAVEPVRELG